MPLACCTVTPAKKKTPGALAPLSPAGGGAAQALESVKEYSAFGQTYKDDGLLSKTSKVTRVVSSGGEGEYVCRRLKIADMQVSKDDELIKHLQSLNSLEHPHICKFVEAFRDKETLYMIYEKAEPTTLFEHIRKRGSLTEEEAADYVRQLTMALSVAHSQGLVHGRLSPRTIILAASFEEDDEETEMQLKICDMGQGYVLRPGPLKGPTGEKELEMERYAVAPEIASNELFGATSCGSAPAGAEKADMWALGVIVYHMLSGTLPFASATREEIVSHVVSKAAPFTSGMWSKLSEHAQDLVSSMLKILPGLRVSSSSLLRHQWIKVAKSSFPRQRMINLMNNLRINVAEGEFKRFVLRVIAAQIRSDGRQAATVEQAFRSLDRNGDGVLTVDEIVAGLKKHMEIPPKELDLLFTYIDRDGSGTLNVQEFLAATMDQKRTTDLPVLWQAFNAFDADGSTVIDADEIDRIVRDLEGSLLSKEQVNQMCVNIRKELTEFSDESGTLDFDQFVYIMLHGKDGTWQERMQRNWARLMWSKCSVDMYNVRAMQPNRNWKMKSGMRGSISGPLSVYRRRAPAG